MKREGGLISLEDLAHYKPLVREPLTSDYKVNGHTWQVITGPPPSSGSIAIEALNILAPIELKSWNDAQSVHWVIEAMRRAFADRSTYLADPAFAKIPLRGMMSTCYADVLRRTIDPERASSSEKIHAGNPAAFEDASTSPGCLPANFEPGCRRTNSRCLQSQLRCYRNRRPYNPLLRRRCRRQCRRQ